MLSIWKCGARAGPERWTYTVEEGVVVMGKIGAVVHFVVYSDAVAVVRTACLNFLKAAPTLPAQAIVVLSRGCAFCVKLRNAGRPQRAGVAK